MTREVKQKIQAIGDAAVAEALRRGVKAALFALVEECDGKPIDKPFWHFAVSKDGKSWANDIEHRDELTAWLPGLIQAMWSQPPFAPCRA